MGAITIRQLDDDVIARLKDKARRSGHSMEEEARIAITRAVGPHLKGEAAVEHFARLRQELFGDRVLPDSVQLFRELREEDPTDWNGE